MIMTNNGINTFIRHWKSIQSMKSLYLTFLVFGYSFLLLQGTHADVFSQSNQSKSNSELDSDSLLLNLNSTNPKNTNANGSISTLFFIIANNTLTKPPVGDAAATFNVSQDADNATKDNGIPLTNLTGALNAADKSIADGNWTISISNDTVRNFNVNMSVINADGTLFHTHAITNLKDYNLKFYPNDTFKIIGKVDVAVNGEIAWKNVDSIILINKGKALTISLDDKATENHFKQQNIYGLVKSYISDK